MGTSKLSAPILTFRVPKTIQQELAQHFTPFEKMRDTLPVLVFYSLERKDDPCKSDSQTFYPF